jgi:site-specific DNA-adenine methylase
MKNLPLFFHYFGSKLNIIKTVYPSPKYETIIEPFCGAASYSLHYYDRKVLLYDISPVIVGIWNYLIHVKASELLRLPLIGPEQTVDELNVCQEAKWLIGFWLTCSSNKPVNRQSGWMKSPVGLGNVSTFWSDMTKRRLATNVHRIRHWKAELLSYEKIQFEGLATWFVDPPYKALSLYPYGEPLDYVKLADWCRSRRGQTIVCENPEGDWLPFRKMTRLPRRMMNTSGTKTNAIECVWVGNNPLFTTTRVVVVCFVGCVTQSTLKS